MSCNKKKHTLHCSLYSVVLTIDINSMWRIFLVSNEPFRWFQFTHSQVNRFSVYSCLNCALRVQTTLPRAITLLPRKILPQLLAGWSALKVNEIVIIRVIVRERALILDRCTARVAYIVKIVIKSRTEPATHFIYFFSISSIMRFPHHDIKDCSDRLIFETVSCNTSKNWNEWEDDCVEIIFSWREI